MKRIPAGSIGILQGSRLLFSDFADNGEMWTGTGPRESRHAVTFPESYVGEPSVMVGFSLWDLDHKHNARVDLQAVEITPEGFTILFRTWGDSRIARIRADWMAIGQVRDEDDWTVD